MKFRIHNPMIQKGFTLIELIIVIVIFGILSVVAAPRFIDVQSDANISKTSAVGAAFQSAVKLVHYKWQVQGGRGPIDNLDVYGTGQNTLDINRNGWPAQSWLPFESDPQLNNTNDCISVWNAILEENGPTVSTGIDESFQVTYSNNTCTFALVAEPGLSIFYDSNDGTVTIDTSF